MTTRMLAPGISLALALTLGADALGQGRQTGTITGATVDSQGLSLPGVTVTVRSPSLQGTRTAVTDINGNYSLPQLPPGPSPRTAGHPAGSQRGQTFTDCPTAARVR